MSSGSRIGRGGTGCAGAKAVTLAEVAGPFSGRYCLATAVGSIAIGLGLGAAMETDIEAGVSGYLRGFASGLLAAGLAAGLAGRYEVPAQAGAEGV